MDPPSPWSAALMAQAGDAVMTAQAMIRRQGLA